MKFFRYSFILALLLSLTFQASAQFSRSNSKKSVPYRANYQRTTGGFGHTLEIRNGTLWAWGSNSFGQLGDGTTIGRNSPVQIGSDNNWVSISAGYGHSVGLKADGTLWAWGWNSTGQVGNGTTTNQVNPIQIGIDNKWISITTGYGSTKAIKSDGTLWAWGENNVGQLGDGTTSIRTIPVQIGTDNKWVSVSMGESHTIALKSDGTLWAWGFNFYSQLGDGTITNRTSPVQIGADNKWAYISAGGYHSIAIKSDGKLWAWGKNSEGQLGDGTSIERSIPVQIGSDNKWVNVTAGSYHTLGLKSDGTMWAWGYNFQGQLGDGTTNNQSIPVQIGTDNKWVDVTAGNNHSLAIKSDGTYWVWGNNDQNQLGFSSTNNPSAPVQISTPGNTWLMISDGSLHSSGIKTDGTLWTWGRNDYGQLGDGTTVNKSRPVQIGAGNTWISVAAGYNHMLAIRYDGTLWSWGKNEYGQLGDGTTTNRSTPVQVGTDNKWVSISGGGDYSVGLKSDGTIWGWGLNDQGQLGDGTTSTRTSPVQIGSDNDWISIVVGGQHTIALKSNGTIWAWGYNGNGGLGMGNYANRYSPTQAGSDNNWSVISGGTENTMAIKTNGTLWACGLNRAGQFGNGTISMNNPNFVQIGSDNSWIILSTGYDHTLGIKSNGTLWATGHNTLGSLGDGTNTDKSTFIQIGSENTWVATHVSRGFHSIGLKTTRDLFCGTGQNNYGQLGDGTTTNRNTYACVTDCPVLYTPSITISATSSSICAGNNVTFTATATNEGTTPVYQWKKNGNNVGTNSASYADAALANGDVITCVLTSNASCTTVPTATSNSIIMVVSAIVTPSVSISATATAICAGSSVTFTATPTNGGTPSYQWKKNGNNVGTNSNTYTDAALVNGDVISCVLSSSINCVTSSTATSNTLTMQVNALPPTPTITAGGPITFCQGGSVTLNGPSAGNNWTQKAYFGGTSRSNAVGFSIGTKGYIGTGYDGTYKNDFWEYDPSTNAWTQKANFGGTARYDAVGFSIGGKGYIGTGYDLNLNYRNDFWEYDPIANTWTQKADFGGAGRQAASGFSIGTKGYIGTGASGLTFRNDFWEYDPSTNTWTQKASFGGTARLEAVGFSIGSKGYIGVGQDVAGSGNYRNDFWEYDPSTNTWTQKANFGGTARYSAVGISIGNKGYVGTGYDVNFSRKDDFWEYDPSTNAWTQKANFVSGYLYGARLRASGFSIGNKGYIGAGDSNGSSYMNDLFEYAPSSLYTYQWSSGQVTSSISVNQSGTYTVSITGLNGCTATSTPITVTVNTLPAAPTTVTATVATICAGSGSNLNATSTGNTIQWYTVASGGTNIGTSASGANFSVSPASTTTYYAESLNPAGCVSATRIPVTVTVNPLPAAPTPVTATNATICAGSNSNLNATSAGNSIQWYTLATGGTNLGASVSAANFVVTPATTTIYYAEAITPGGCISATRAAVTVTVNPLPAAPTPVTATASTICAGSSSNLNATSSGNTIQWYIVETGGTNMGTSASAANFAVTPATTTIYYAEAITTSSGTVTGSQTFNYTGSVQTFTVPAGVTTLTIDASGAQGGSATPSGPGSGGNGGRIQGTISVSPGQILNIYVGGQGANGSTNAAALGGYNGGGNGAFAGSFGPYGGGGGGGATDIRVFPYGLANRVVVAGGGAGGAFNYCAGSCDRGGMGGGLTGENGYGGSVNLGQGAGGGGSQVLGGSAGFYSGYCNGSGGVLGIGGAGGTCTNSGGGGGGGYYGGGGGVWAGGGGGSSYLVGGSHTQGYKTGNGQVIITWSGVSTSSCASATRTAVTVTVNNIPAAPSLVTASSPSICVGASSNLRATSEGNTIQWYTVATGGTNIGTSASGANFAVNPASTTTYYAEALTPGGCFVSATRTAVTVTVNPSPSTPTISAGGPTTFCQGGSVTFNGALPAGNTWIQKANFGGTARQGAVGFAIGTKGYLGTGQDGFGVKRDFWEYDPITNVWTQKADFGGAARSNAVGFSIGSKGYVGTGSSVTGSKNDFWEFDPVANTWTQKANFGGVARQSAVGFSIGTKGYIGTGVADEYNSAFYSDFWEYNVSANSWTQKTSVGGGTRGYAAGFSIGNKGYIGSGLNTTVLYTRNDFWEYDPTTNTWSQKAAFSSISRQKPIGFSIGALGYIGLGYNGSSPTSDFWEYDPAANTWNQKQSFPANGRYFSAGFSAGGKGYVGTGATTNPYSNDFWEYSPGSNATYTYAWSSGQNTSSINVNQSGNYTLTVTDPNGCSATSTPVTVTVNSLPPTPVISASGPTTFCQGGSVTLNAMVSSGSGWTTKSMVGGGGRSNAVGFSIGSKGYIGTGISNGAYRKDFWQYDPVNNTWTQKADFGGTARAYAVGFSIGSKGYIGTGLDATPADSYRKDFWEYDPASNTWNQKADFGGIARAYAVGFSIGAHGFIGTGQDINYTNYNDFWKFDPVSNSWTQQADVGGSGRYFAVGFGIGSKGYVGTGVDDSQANLNDFWEFDPAANTWVQKAHVGGSPRFLAAGFSNGTKGYVGTGIVEPGFSYTNDFWEYDPVNNTWTQQASFGGTARESAVGFAIGVKGYIGTGIDTNSGNLSDFWEFGTAGDYSYNWSTAQTSPSISVNQSGNYTVTVTDIVGCSATSLPVTVTVNSLPPTPVISASGPTTICQGSTLVLNSNVSVSNAEQWIQRANFGGASRYGAIAFAIGENCYIGSGLDNNYQYTNDFWEYNPSTNSWSQKANLTNEVRSYAVGFSIGSKGYIGTGVTGSASTSQDFWEYDPQSNTWTQKADFGGTARVGAVGFAIGSKGYIGLGYDEVNNTLVDIWEFNPTQNQWIQKQNFPGLPRRNTTGLVIGSKGYIGLGYDDSFNLLQDFWEFDPSANAWIQKNNFAGDARYSAVGFSMGNKGYVGTGLATSGFVSDMWQFDPVTNAWLQKVNFAGGSRATGIAISTGTTAYIGTGINDGIFKNDFWQYQISSGGSSVLWSSGQSTSSINVSQAGNYTVTVTDANGCSATSAPITVTANPNVNAGSISGTSLMVEGNTATFTSNGDAGGTWSSSNNTVATVNPSSGLVSALTAGSTTISYTVTGCGGPSVANFSLTVNSAITAGTVSGPSPICASSTGLYTSTGTPGGTWSSSNNAVATVNPTSGLVTAISGGTATITYTVGSVSASASLTVASGAAPVVTGFTNICPYVGNATPITYTATAVGASSFNWSLPPNVSLVSQTNSLGVGTITVTFASGFTTQANKQIRVTATSVCGTSPMTIYYLLAQNPSTPQPIVASSANVCPSLGTNIPITYTIPKVVGASSYIWNAQSGTTTITHPNGLGVNDTTVTVTFTSGFTTSNITVQAVNSCGTSGGRALTITRANPATPGLIAGPVNVCANIAPAGTAVTYTVAQQPTVTSYTWTLPPGVIGLTGQGTNSVTFTFPAGFTGGTISVIASNGCGTSTARSLTVATLSPATPSVIDVVQTTVCPNRVFTYSLASMPANATTVNWTYPAGGSVVTQTAFSITIAYPATAVTGTVTAQAVNNCGNSVIRSANVFLPACPPEEKENGNDTPVYTKGKVTAPAELFEVQVFPNPTVSDYKVKVRSLDKNSQVTVRILDLQGRELSRMIMMPEELKSFGSKLTAGAYFMEVLQGEKRAVQKLIKL